MPKTASIRWITQLTSRLSLGQMEIFKAPSPPAPIRGAWIRSFHTWSIYLQSVRSYRRPRGWGWQTARRWEINRDTQQHNVKVNRNTNHQYIRLVYAGSSGVHRAPLPLYEEWLVPHDGDDGGWGSRRSKCHAWLVFLFVCFFRVFLACWEKRTTFKSILLV